MRRAWCSCPRSSSRTASSSTRRDRASGKTIGSFGRNGTYAGQFHWINAIVMDSKGNLYTGEVEENKRIQKFVPVMANAKR